MNPSSRPRLVRLVFGTACLAALALLAGAALAAPPDDDPFADSNKAGAAPAARAPKGKAPGQEKAAVEDDPFAEANQGVLLEHEKPFTWSQDIYVKPAAKPGEAKLGFKITVQVCKGTCVWGTFPLEVPVRVTEEQPELPAESLKPRLARTEPPEPR